MDNVRNIFTYSFLKLQSLAAHISDSYYLGQPNYSSVFRYISNRYLKRDHRSKMMLAERKASNIFNKNHVIVCRILIEALIKHSGNVFVCIKHSFENLSVHLCYSFRRIYKTSSIRVISNSIENLTNSTLDSLLIYLLNSS